MSEYPTYLIHYGIQGQKWGVRRFQNDDGTYTSDGLERRRAKENYKELKKDYKKSVKEARKEYNKVVKDSGKNKLLSSKAEQHRAIDKVDDFAIKKAAELYEKYKNVKMSEAELKGKAFDLQKLKARDYFEDLGLDPGILDLSYPTLTYYKTYVGKNNKTKVRKQSIQYYQT